MTMSQLHTVSNNQILINLPEGFKEKSEVMVTVKATINLRSEKMALLKKAATDPLFKADIDEVNDDFNDIDFESLEG